MLICTLPIDEDCPAWGSNCECFPWCDYLREMDINVTQDAKTIQVKRFAPREEGIGDE